MTPEKFVADYYPFAKECELQTGLNAIATLAQAALESAWGEKAVGNNFFGIKARKDIPHEHAQLFTTTEILRSPDVKFPEIISITPLPNNRYKYKVKDWFMKYDSPAECFKNRANFFIRNPRYAQAIKVADNYNNFFDAIADAGYATDPHYADTLKSVAKTIERYV